MTNYESNVTSWKVNEKDYPDKGKINEKMFFLLKYAILAPSSHNSQPWKFHVEDNIIYIFADDDSWLEIADPDKRELYLSVGCAVENLLIAAEHFGYSHTEEYFPHGEDNSLVAKISFSSNTVINNPRNPELFEQLITRHTNHSLYKDIKIPKKVMNELHTCILEEGFWVFSTNEGPYSIYSEEELRQRIDELITRADSIQLTDPDYKKELATWVGKGAFGASWMMSKISQLAITYLNISKGQTKKDSDMILSAPSLAVITSALNDRCSMVKTGQIYERIALTATSLGLSTHSMSQILEVPETKAELMNLINVPEVKAEVAKLSPMENVYPIHTFRLGYAEPEKEHTPRKPLEEMIQRQA